MVREDLPQGARVAQSVHAAVEMAVEHPREFRAWWKSSNTVVVLLTKDEERLTSIFDDAIEKNMTTVLFSEPDMGNRPTAMAVIDQGAKRLLRKLKLA